VRLVVHYSVYRSVSVRSVWKQVTEHLRALWSAGAESLFLMWGGIGFQIIGPQVDKARFPNCVHVLKTTAALVVEEYSCQHPESSVSLTVWQVFTAEHGGHCEWKWNAVSKSYSWTTSARGKWCSADLLSSVHSLCNELVLNKQSVFVTFSSKQLQPKHFLICTRRNSSSVTWGAEIEMPKGEATSRGHS